MKRIIRSGFILVMAKERTFTRDLHPAYKTFVKYYPQQESDMREALELAIEPTDDISKIITFIDSFGMWMKNETQKEFTS